MPVIGIPLIETDCMEWCYKRVKLVHWIINVSVLAYRDRVESFMKFAYLNLLVSFSVVHEAIIIYYFWSIEQFYNTSRLFILFIIDFHLFADWVAAVEDPSLKDAIIFFVKTASCIDEIHYLESSCTLHIEAISPFEVLILPFSNTIMNVNQEKEYPSKSTTWITDNLFSNNLQ